MVETYISLKTIESIRKFVNTVILLDYEIDLVQGRYVIDAKSIMGIFSLDLLAPITVKAHTEDVDGFKKAIAEFVIA